MDGNQAEIVAALRAIGCRVRCLHQVGAGIPDLLVWSPKTRLFALLEIKEKKKRLTPIESAFFEEFDGAPIYVVHSLEEAMGVFALKS